jgi:hypothetical protein
MGYPIQWLVLFGTRPATSAELDDCQQPSKTTLNQKLARVTREASHTQEDESEDENYQTAREDNLSIVPPERRR